MESHVAGFTRCSYSHTSHFSSHSRKLETQDIHNPKHNFVFCNTRFSFKWSISLSHASIRKCPTCHPPWRTLAMSFNLEDEPSLSMVEDYSRDNDKIPSEDSDDSEIVIPQNLDTDELKLLLADAERSNLTRKLSEANQHNRFLKRQLQTKEDDFVNFKSELAAVEFEIQALVALAEEVAKSGIRPDSRKINGKYIQSQLLSRLKAVNEKLKAQIKGVNAVQSKEVHLFWYGVAESVQVMGSFDGWNQGEHLSPEHTGSFNKFATTLILRPGRHEIKFLVDGEWHLSPEFPTIGEGMMENNLLIVE